MTDINDVRHTSTLAKFEEAVRRSSPVTESVRDVLQHYAEQYCEGWCKDSRSSGFFDDCGGCRARVALNGFAQTPPRQPTEAMLRAARDWSVKKYGLGIGNDAAIGCWQAMLAALSDTSTICHGACQVCGEMADLKCGPSRFGEETWACKGCWEPDSSPVRPDTRPDRNPTPDAPDASAPSQSQPE